MMGPMSAIGPKQTCAVAPHMSAFRGRADISLNYGNVHFCPKANMRSSLRPPG
jgi:hypothetical protein